MMACETIEKKLGNIENLPTLPIVIRQIQKIMSNPNSNMNQIAAVVAKDQALASKTIRLVNSAYYGLRTRIPSISQAIVVLGLNTLNNLMLGLSVVKTFEKSAMLGFDSLKFWEHCFGTALLSKKLAGKIGYSDPEECFIAGLLHDMGRLVLQQFLNTEFERALQKSESDKKPLFLVEKGMIGFDHSQVGMWLAEKWNLPEMLKVTIRFHHEPRLLPQEYKRYSQLLSIIAYANYQCGIASIGNSGDQVYPGIVLPDLKLPPESVCKKLTEEVKIEIVSLIAQWTQN
jgi:putative nucleotidyltransferase with HDIG domain